MLIAIYATALLADVISVIAITVLRNKLAKRDAEIAMLRAEYDAAIKELSDTKTGYAQRVQFAEDRAYTRATVDLLAIASENDASRQLAEREVNAPFPEAA